MPRDRSSRSTRPVIAALVAAAVLVVPGWSAADPLPQVALILDDEGVVINVAALSSTNDYTGWLEAMRANGATVIIWESNTVGIGSVLQPDGSFARPAAPEPPSTLPDVSADEGEPGWREHGPAVAEREAPRSPVIGDPGLRRFLGVPGPEDGAIRTALHIVDGVVVNASVYNTVTSVDWLAARRAQGATIVIADGGGIGWVVQDDGTITPPSPQPGWVWNGSEWRAPGTASVVRPDDVPGWALDRAESIADGAQVRGTLIVPDRPVGDDGPEDLRAMSERSIVMIESSGATVPFLARYDGFDSLLAKLGSDVDSAVETHEAATGGPVDAEASAGFREAVRRVVERLWRVFGGDSNTAGA